MPLPMILGAASAASGLFGMFRKKPKVSKELQELYRLGAEAGREGMSLARRWTSPNFQPFNELEKAEMLQGLTGEQFRQRPLDELNWRQAASRAYGRVPEAAYMSTFDPEKGEMSRQRIASRAVEAAALKAIEAKQGYATAGASIMGSLASLGGQAGGQIAEMNYRRDVDESAKYLGVSSTLADAAVQLYLTRRLTADEEPTLGEPRSFGSYASEGLPNFGRVPWPQKWGR